MRLTLTVLFAAAAAFAQNAATMSPFRAMPAPVGTRPSYGNILYPGGMPQSHATRLGSVISGSMPYSGVVPGHQGTGGRPRTIVVPYAVPVWTGGYYDGGMAYAQQQAPVTVVMPQQTMPQIVINNYTDGVRTSTVETTEETGRLRVYEATPAAKPAPAVTGSYVRDDKPNIYTIVLRDNTVAEAIGYWAKDGVLHYVTPQATIRQVALELVDRDASVKVNADRKLDFDLR